MTSLVDMAQSVRVSKGAPSIKTLAAVTDPRKAAKMQGRLAAKIKAKGGATWDDVARKGSVNRAKSRGIDTSGSQGELLAHLNSRLTPWQIASKADISKSLVEMSQVVKGDKKSKENPHRTLKGYRRSYLEGINPRSRTQVREGSGVQRIGGPLIAGTIGATAGNAAARIATKGRSPEATAQATKWGAGFGGAVGSSAMLNRNIKSKDTISTNRRTGQRAKGKVDLSGYGTYNLY